MTMSTPKLRRLESQKKKVSLIRRKIMEERNTRGNKGLNKMEMRRKPRKVKERKVIQEV